MDPQLTFGEWLEDQYLRRGYTQVEFAEAIDVAQSTVSGWVSGGKRPRRRVLPVIVRVLEVPEEELLHRAGYVARQPAWFEADSPDRSDGGPAVDFDDPFLMFWASYSGELDPHDKEILQELARTLAQKGKSQARGHRGGFGT